MFIRARRVLSTAVLSAVALLLAAPSPALADVPPPGKVLSRWENLAAGNAISRDCGYSKKVPGSSNRSLWLFCDSVWSGTSSGFWLGVTAAVGPFTAGQVPTGLTEIPAPPQAINAPNDRAPAGLLPIPSGLVLPNGSDCQVSGSSYGASWASGVARQPTGADPAKLLITYADVCVHNAGITTERFGLVEYNPATNALSGQRQVHTALPGLPFQKNLGSPIFSGGYLYLTGYLCDDLAWGTCGAGRITLARVAATPTSWRNASNYRYWNGTGWTSDHNAAVSMVPGAKPMAVHMEDFSALGKGFVIVEQTDLAGKFRIWRSASLTSGWAVTRTGTAPCGGQQGLDLCRAYFGHPELSTTSNLLMSYYDPTNDHVNVMAVPW